MKKTLIALVWPQKLKIEEAKKMKKFENFDGVVEIEEEKISGKIETFLGEMTIDGRFLEKELAEISIKKGARTFQTNLTKKDSEESVYELWSGTLIFFNQKINLVIVALA